MEKPRGQVRWGLGELMALRVQSEHGQCRGNQTGFRSGLVKWRGGKVAMVVVSSKDWVG
jgi:hypothetical protein